MWQSFAEKGAAMAFRDVIARSIESKGTKDLPFQPTVAMR